MALALAKPIALRRPQGDGASAPPQSAVASERLARPARYPILCLLIHPEARAASHPQRSAALLCRSCCLFHLSIAGPSCLLGELLHYQPLHSAVSYSPLRMELQTSKLPPVYRSFASARLLAVPAP